MYYVCLNLSFLHLASLARWSLFGSGDQMDFWEVITRFAHPASIASVHDMEEIQSDLGRVSIYNYASQML